ncbi:MAG: hypothetical protein IPK82_23325 [Polyangiaceae bacterium]|nr:hypothetical protein [Polyangiaceae bacterium]
MSDRDVQLLLSGYSPYESAGYSIETPYESAGYSIETPAAGADLVSGADLIAGASDETLADLISGAMARGKSMDEVLRSLPTFVRARAHQAFRRAQAKSQRVQDQIRTQPQLKDDGFGNWYTSDEGFDSTTNVVAGATFTVLVTLQVPFRPERVFLNDSIADFFKLTRFFVGRTNALVGQNGIPGSRFKSNSTDLKWKLPSARPGTTIAIDFLNIDVSDHRCAGSINGLFLE